MLYGGSVASGNKIICIKGSSGSSPRVYNNTMIAGSSPTVQWIFQLRVDGGAACHFDLRNTIFADFATQGNYGVYHMDSGSGHSPTYLTTNLFYLSPNANSDGAGPVQKCSQFEALKNGHQVLQS